MCCGKRDVEKVRYTLMSAIWKVKIDSALKVYPREQTVPISSVNPDSYSFLIWRTGKSVAYFPLQARGPFSGLI